MSDGRGAERVLVGRPEGKRPLGIHRRIILKWIFKKAGFGNMDWIYLAQDRGR